MLNQYTAAIAAVTMLGEGVAQIIDALKQHAKATLSEADYAALEASWLADADETATNAGLTG